MNYQEYLNYTASILANPNPEKPYDDLEYFNYTKLNESRMKRWNKTKELNLELVERIKALSAPQKWILITEPWCGDASHNVPFIAAISALNPLIELDIQLRDQPPFLIDHYLTNGGKGIPKLIVRNQEGEDVFTWGPRPAGCQILMNELKSKEAPFEMIKIELQNWYNANKGVELQEELLQMLSSL